ncbi:MAG: lysophospholipid acyltransferase family protein [Patescibacteria group bacterium]|nr:lysophospholipid acyltransferase family protein [Patescibacteria group bacterium]
MNKIASWFCKIFLKPIVNWLLIKEVRGLENIPKGSFILVSNHLSYLDIIVDSYLCVPRRFHFIGQTDGWKGIMKWLIRALYFVSGVIPLDRTSDESREKVLKEAIKVLKKGNVLVLYPEGRRSTSGLLQDGKLGTAKIFLKTGIPILPAGLKGTFELMPPQGKLKIKRIVEINIGKPLFFNEEFNLAQNLDEDSLEYQQILEKITDKIMAELRQLTI